ncbi:MAG: DUF433 domain-containing protein [Leptolyngbya sp. SIO4C1]|nr:DUF433 domain-containing protein [Leptolyngbya sp. SIO4C1]
MNEQALLNRIATDPKIFGGKPMIQEHQISVEQVLGRLAAGDTTATILASYPLLALEDIQACLLYAQALVQQVQSSPSLANLRALVPNVLQQAPYIRLLVLFGSRARGSATSNSDWDFALLCDEASRHQYEHEGFNHFRIWTILEQVFHIRDNKVDVVDLNLGSPAIAYQVARYGQVLYEQEPGMFQQFQRKAWKAFADTQKFRDLRQRSIALRLEKLGA